MSRQNKVFFLIFQNARKSYIVVASPQTKMRSLHRSHRHLAEFCRDWVLVHASGTIPGYVNMYSNCLLQNENINTVTAGKPRFDVSMQMLTNSATTSFNQSPLCIGMT